MCYCLISCWHTLRKPFCSFILNLKRREQHPHPGNGNIYSTHCFTKQFPCWLTEFSVSFKVNLLQQPEHNLHLNVFEHEWSTTSALKLILGLLLLPLSQSILYTPLFLLAKPLNIHFPCWRHSHTGFSTHSVISHHKHAAVLQFATII